MRLLHQISQNLYTAAKIRGIINYSKKYNKRKNYKLLRPRRYGGERGIIMMNGLFANGNTAAIGARGLEMTAQLTSLATSIANEILSALEKKQSVLSDDMGNASDENLPVATKAFEDFKSKVANSMTSHDVMDSLINEMTDLSFAKVDFLTNLSDEEIDKMIKSQQSKRSRSKSKTMTMDNYRTMMVGAISENLLRMASGKDKSSVGFSGKMSEVTFNQEQLDALSMNQEELRKAIRNIQSKKSIAKSKANFDETSERWTQLLVAEEQLKSIRIGAPIKAVAVDARIDKLTELLSQVEDVNSLKAADSKSFLAAIKDLLNPTV
jgi:hypothetical protein